LDRVEPIAIEKVQANIDANLQLIDHDQCNDQRAAKSPLGTWRAAKPPILTSARSLVAKLGISEASDPTDHRDE